jgi:hypothetical protein
MKTIFLCLSFAAASALAQAVAPAIEDEEQVGSARHPAFH